MPDKPKSQKAAAGPIPTTLYPIKGRWLHDVPVAVIVVPTTVEAKGLIASGAFTDDAEHADRDHAAPDFTGETPDPAPVETPAADEPAAQATDLVDSQPAEPEPA